MSSGLPDTWVGFQPGPGHLQAERNVIGRAMYGREDAETLADVVKAEYFFRSAHQIIWEAIIRLADAGKPVEPVTVLAELGHASQLAATGGGPYLHSCYSAATILDNAVYYAEQVAADYRRRMLNAAAESVMHLTRAPGFDPETGFDVARQRFDDALAAGEPASERDIAALSAEVISSLEDHAAPGLATGFADLDKMLPAGLAPGEMVIIGGRPGTAKSSLALNIAAHLGVDKGLPVYFSSLEMRADELMCRLLAAEAGVSLTRILAHTLESRHWDRIARAQAAIASSGIVIDDTPVQTLAHIRAQLRRVARTRPARVAYIDYLQLLHTPGRAENRQTEVAALSRGIKLIAREFSIPVIVLAQLNRNPEGRIGKRPLLSDLRESGGLEQDADKVFLLYREDMADKESARAGELDVIVAKQRNGPTGTVTLAWQGEYCRAMNLAWTPSSALAGAR